MGNKTRVKYMAGMVLPKGNIIVSVTNGASPPYIVICYGCGKEVGKYPSTINSTCLKCKQLSMKKSLVPGVAKKIRQYKHSAKKRGYEWSISDADAEALFVAPCEYCGQTELNGIDRVDNTIGYVEGNVVSCCSTCNYAKKDMTMDKWTAWLDRVAVHRG